jgi:hypothetical protein
MGFSILRQFSTVNKKSMLTRFDRAEVVVDAGKHPHAEHGFQTSRVILAFANGNTLILTLFYDAEVGVGVGHTHPDSFWVGQQPIRMIKSIANWACSSAVRAGDS